jgi:hypothetical protein
VVIGVTVLCLLAGSANTALAARPGLGPTTISTSEGEIGEPAIAVDPSGAAAIAWVAGGDLRFATRTGPTARWHVSARSFPTARRPQLAMDARGDLILAWEQWEGSALVLKTAFRSAGHGWRLATSLSGDVGEGQGRWRLVMNAAGDAAITWSQYRVEDFFGHPLDAYFVLVATMSGASGTWGPTTELSSATGYGTSPDLALDRQGEAIVAWRQYEPSIGTLDVEAALGSATPTGAPWSHPVAVSGEGEYIAEEGPRVAIGDGGGALVAWGRADAGCRGGLPSTLVGSRLVTGGAWSAPGPISGPGECPVEVQLGIDPEGRATALWDSLSPQVSDLEVASGRLSDGGWSGPTRLATVGRLPASFANCVDDCPAPPLGLARLGVGDGDDGLVVWRQEGEGVIGASLARGQRQKPQSLRPAAGSTGASIRAVSIAFRPPGEALVARVVGRAIQVDSLRIPPEGRRTRNVP